MKNLVKDLDLFSKPFVFFVGDKKNKSTFIGGALSLSIILISIVYFYYLINMYLTDKVEPKINSSISIENDRIEIEIDESFFIFEMLIQGEPLKQYEKRIGKNYLTYTVYYETYASDGTCTAVVVPLIECEDPKFAGFICMDTAAVKEKNIFLEPINKVSSDYALSIHFCDPLQELNCATEEEIYDTILQSANYFQIYTKIRQYSPTTRSYKNGYKSEYFYFDLNSVIYTRISLIKATTTVTEGLLIQTSTDSEDIFDFKRIDTVFSREKIYDRMGIDGFGYIVFEINQVRNIIVVQHAMITEVLAQFMSIFNSLLTIGILAKLLAESHIVEDMNSILLKEYYKKTALKLVGKREKKNKQQQIDGKANPSGANQGSVDNSHAIAQLQRKINDTNFAEESRQYFEMSCFQRFKIFFSQLIGNPPEIDSRDKGTDSIVYQRLLSQSVKRINIFEVYKDLIKLKMSVKLMLTKEQYAAMQFCGSEIFSEENLNQPEVIVFENANQNNNNNLQECLQAKDIVVMSDSPGEFAKQDFLSPSSNNGCFLSGQNSRNEQLYPQISLMQPAINQDQDLEEKQATSISTKNNDCADNHHQNSKLYQLFPSIKRQNELIGTSEQITCQDQQENSSKDNKLVSGNHLLFSGQNNKIQLSKNTGDNIELEESSIISVRRGQDEVRKDEKINTFIGEIQEKMKSVSQGQGLGRTLPIIQERNNFERRDSSAIESRDLHDYYKCHLYEMDSIEENEEKQEELLSRFLISIRRKIGTNKDLKKLNHIDRHIYQSLLGEEGGDNQGNIGKWMSEVNIESNRNCIQKDGSNNDVKDSNERNKNNSKALIYSDTQHKEGGNEGGNNCEQDQEQSDQMNSRRISLIEKQLKATKIAEDKQTTKASKSQSSLQKQEGLFDQQGQPQSYSNKTISKANEDQQKEEELIEFN